MRKTVILLLLLFIGLNTIIAQKINFTTKEAKKKYTLAIHNGLRLDTVARGVTSVSGTGEILIPTKYKNVPVMGVFSIEGKTSMSFIINGENFQFTYSSTGSTSFVNSKENELLYDKSQSGLQDKYKGTYAHGYLKSRNAIYQMAEAIMLKRQGKADFYKESKARSSALNNMDMDKLYYSNLWYYAIDGLMNLSIGQKGFGTDITRLLDKTKNDKVYTVFVEDLITITNQFGMDDAFDIIIDHVQKSGRIKYPQGVIYDAFAMAKIKPGVVAPQIKGLSPAIGKTTHKYTMLIFHQPDCENCQRQMKQLEMNYRFYEGKEVRIVTISGALTSADFQKERKNHPWKDSLCDFKGFAGESFLAYGVVSTPMIYLLDNRGVVLKRFALITDVERFIRAQS